GAVMFNSPHFEGRDVSALIDFVAAQREALLDGAGDPRVGMSGSSYGGGIQFVSAAIDPRIDAVVPDIAWHSLLTSVFRDGAVKTGWLSAICGGGEVLALTGGIFGGGLQLGGTAPELKRACVEGLAGGPISAASRQWLADRGPGDLVDRIRAPTLITQGTVDTLFPLGEAIANYEVLRRNDVAVKMLWYCGGHGECGTPRGDPRHVARAGLAWFARWLKRDASVDTGPRFEWLADDGVWRAGPDYPLAPSGTLDATGTGNVQLLPLDGINARPVSMPTTTGDALTVPFASPTSTSDVIGEPLLKLTYRGTAVPRQSFLYAQIVDGDRVAGGQATPIPVVLDGRTRTVQRALETLALRARRDSNLRLRISSGTALYGPQRSLGRVRLQSIQASLPLVDATRSARPATSVSTARTRRRQRCRSARSAASRRSSRRCRPRQVVDAGTRAVSRR
ncbi:MAG: CocE/NonD family hydrolase, partial [Chloroflexota bacterium]|nr:CocE/NonD family hydrolase [Chloroflexota bacterium]